MNKEIKEDDICYVDTLHSAKGMEADHIAIIMDITNKIYENLFNKDNNFDDELRLLYVGATRAKKSLNLIELGLTGITYDIKIKGGDSIIYGPQAQDGPAKILLLGRIKNQYFLGSANKPAQQAHVKRKLWVDEITEMMGQLGRFVKFFYTGQGVLPAQLNHQHLGRLGRKTPWYIVVNTLKPAQHFKVNTINNIEKIEHEKYNFLYSLFSKKIIGDGK